MQTSPDGSFISAIEGIVLDDDTYYSADEISDAFLRHIEAYRKYCPGMTLPSVGDVTREVAKAMWRSWEDDASHQATARNTAENILALWNVDATPTVKPSLDDIMNAVDKSFSYLNEKILTREGGDPEPEDPKYVIAREIHALFSSVQGGTPLPKESKENDGP